MLIDFVLRKSAMKDTDDFHRLASHPVDNDVGQARNEEFPGIFETAHTPTQWKICQLLSTVV
jgi:hypothetical protein